MCVLSLKVPIRKKSGNLSYVPRNKGGCNRDFGKDEKIQIFISFCVFTIIIIHLNFILFILVKD